MTRLQEALNEFDMWELGRLSEIGPLKYNPDRKVQESPAERHTKIKGVNMKRLEKVIEATGDDTADQLNNDFVNGNLGRVKGQIKSMSGIEAFKIIAALIQVHGRDEAIKLINWANKAL